MKKTLNQLKASRRNLSLMLLAGMITKRIELILINGTISNTIYTIRCHFGYKETKFKYKHE